ncbi:hypothetical protein FNZ56_08080 [Pseudoluteimonas lycopersici]|uniref:Lipoprotein n=1 Tax=Pseudoluteimonas lycopersici TaxID=1324796 RepID=A0A516V5N6_9GAMM|nr:hypothetical protein [Lysobacter lycopersici]QDQ73836.1 hypothetical protein FNZ56_08080 [Lysobacter lycopersici]
MRRSIAIARRSLLLALALLSACGTGGTSYSNRIVDNGHDVLYGKVHAEHGVARFECRASDSGVCHYTLYPGACVGKPDCGLAPLRRFAVVRGHGREIAGLRDFRVCVSIDERPVRADCEPVARVATR